MSKINKYFIYLCGGMGSFGKERFNESNEWRVDIKEKLEDISGGKVVAINPNDHFSFLNDSNINEREVMEYDLHRVRESDLIIVNFNDPKSIGSAAEMAIAYDRRIPILGLCEDCEAEELHPWLREFCNKIFTDREELLLYVCKHYINGD